MTNTQNTSPGMLSAAAQVAAERYGVIGIEGDRAVLIAALHTVINWLIDHPSIPCPQYIDLMFHPRAGVNPTAVDLAKLAERLDGRVGGRNGVQYTECGIPLGDGADGVNARYVAFGRDNDQAW